MQHAKKVVPDSPGLVDFVIRLVNSVLNLPNGQVKFFNKRTVKSILLTKTFLGLVEITFWLVNASFSMPEWQVVFPQGAEKVILKNDFLCTLGAVAFSKKQT